MQEEIKDLILDSSTKNTSSWAIVRDGVVAEFSVVKGDEVDYSFEKNYLKVDTPRATLCINFDSKLDAIVAESGAHGCTPWTQNIYLCIPKQDAKMSCRDKLTHLGHYKEGQDEGELWDLGLGKETLDACIIAKDEQTNKLLQQKEGQYVIDDPNFLRELVRHSPTRFFKSKYAYIIVRQKIPLDGEDELEGPHTHLLPPIIQSGKHFHAPIPDEMIPMIQTDPFGSVIDGNGDFYKWNGFEEDKFQNFLRKYGNQEYLLLKESLKQKIIDGLSNDATRFIEEYSDSKKQDVFRIILAQIVCDDKTDVQVRKKALKMMENIHSVNLRGLKQWVQNMAPQIQN
ncbi:MAG: hypothetical protein ACE5GR_07790 [Nitrosopumilus sp.]